MLTHAFASSCSLASPHTLTFVLLSPPLLAFHLFLACGCLFFHNTTPLISAFCHNFPRRYAESVVFYKGEDTEFNRVTDMMDNGVYRWRLELIYRGITLLFFAAWQGVANMIVSQSLLSIATFYIPFAAPDSASYSKAIAFYVAMGYFLILFGASIASFGTLAGVVHRVAQGESVPSMSLI